MSMWTVRKRATWVRNLVYICIYVLAGLSIKASHQISHHRLFSLEQPLVFGYRLVASFRIQSPITTSAAAYRESYYNLCLGIFLFPCLCVCVFFSDRISVLSSLY